MENKNTPALTMADLEHLWVTNGQWHFLPGGDDGYAHALRDVAELLALVK